MPPGTYEVVSEARDASWSSFCTAPRRFHVDANVRVASVLAEPSAIGPATSGSSASSRVTFRLSGAGDVTASVALPSGERASIFRAAGVSGDGSFDWSGTTLTGARLAEG